MPTRRLLVLLWCLCILAAVDSSHSAAHATPPSRVEATAVDRDALLASARKHLDDDAVSVLTAAIDDGADGRAGEKVQPPLVALRNRKLVSALVEVSKRAVLRGERRKAEAFFAEIKRGRLIRGSGHFYTTTVDPKTRRRSSRGYGGPLVVELELQEPAGGGLAIVVFYRLVNPAVIFGETREGPRFTYPIGR